MRKPDVNKYEVSLEYLQQERKKIGQRLRRARKAKGYTSADKFAQTLGMDSAQYRRYEGGQVNFTIDILFSILHALNMTIEQLFTENKKNAFVVKKDNS